MAGQMLAVAGAQVVRLSGIALNYATQLCGVVLPTTVAEAGFSGIPGSVVTSFQLGQSKQAGSEISSLFASGTCSFLQNTGIALCAVRAGRIFMAHTSQTYVPERTAERSLSSSPVRTAAPPAAASAPTESRRWLSWGSSSAPTAAPAAVVVNPDGTHKVDDGKVTLKSRLCGRVSAASSFLSTFATVQIAKQALIAGALYNANNMNSLPIAGVANRVVTWVVAGAMAGAAADVIRFVRTSSQTVGLVPKKIV